MTKGIFIISVARATSTTLYKIFERAMPVGTPCLLEPFSQAYYIKNKLTDAPGFTFQSSLPTTFEDTIDHILSLRGQPVLIKDLAHQCEHWLSESPQVLELLTMFHFIFLIRSPALTIPSAFYPYTQSHQEADFGPSDVGLTQLSCLYNWVAAKTGHPPLILEAEAYLADPERILPSYFAQVGLSFDKACLAWPAMSETEAQQNPYYSLWGDTWFGNLRKSTGVTNVSPQHKYASTVENHPQLREIYEHELPAYLKLKKKKNLYKNKNGHAYSYSCRSGYSQGQNISAVAHKT